MKRLAIILSLSSSPAFAEITPMDVIESWRTVYAGSGEAISYDSLQAGPDGKSVLLNNVTSVSIISDSTSTSHFDWVRMQPNIDGGILITFSPAGETVDVTRLSDGTEITTTARFDFSALALMATGFPSDIRYSYNAPQVTYSEITGEAAFGSRMEMTFTGVSGEETAITNVTESGPRVADFGEYRFERVEVKMESQSLIDAPSVTQFVAEHVVVTYRWEFPLTDIPSAPVALMDLPPQTDLKLEIQTNAISGAMSDNSPLGTNTVSFGHESGGLSMRFAHDQFRFEMVSLGSRLGMRPAAPERPRFDLGLAELRANITMPFRRETNPAPFSAGLSLNGLALDEESWASVDPENSMGRPKADISTSLSGLMMLTSGIFEGGEGLNGVDAPFFIPDLTVDTLRIAAGGAVIEGQGDLRFNPRRNDPDTDLPMAKGALDFAIIGALGFLDRFGRLTDVDPMAILGAKGGLGMFSSPTDAPDSFTSRVEFLSGGGIVVNGQAVR
ncbi:MAG: hypothetical protein GQ535_01525 [Rhodobacteraceae bacterium]|nr:hypothetical protein [Paracoccaceae bacterium]